jgi:hypothetical protein
MAAAVVVASLAVAAADGNRYRHERAEHERRNMYGGHMSGASIQPATRFPCSACGLRCAAYVAAQGCCAAPPGHEWLPGPIPFRSAIAEVWVQAL